MTETEKMLNGKLYDAGDPDLSARRVLAHQLCRDYNLTDESQEAERKKILDVLLPDRGEGTYLQGPIQFDYGIYTRIGKNVTANFNFTVLDVCPVTIGDGVLFGPNCTIAAPLHPMDPVARGVRTRADGSQYVLEYGDAVNIGSDCWFGSNVVVCGGVTIGDGCVIGAGSVVTRDIPAGWFAAGSPCRPIRRISDYPDIRKYGPSAEE